jgi:OOP family OmpA-OmpF porin
MLPLFSMTPPGPRRSATSFDAWAAFLFLLVGAAAAGAQTGDPNLKLLVVGHTDNVGGYDANMTLSDRRAAAVFQTLTSKHGIPAVRLRAVGVGMAAPVAPNETEAGRAKNRRVELVRQ